MRRLTEARAMATLASSASASLSRSVNGVSRSVVIGAAFRASVAGDEDSICSKLECQRPGRRSAHGCSERPRGPCHRRPQRHLERPRHCSTPTPRRRQCRIERLGLAVGSGEHGGRVYPRPDRRSCRPMLASGVAWGGTLSALRPHHLSITLIARCIAKYRSPDTFPCFGPGVYTVHTSQRGTHHCRAPF